MLMLLGGAWLLDALVESEVPWDWLLPGGLIAIGLVLLQNVRSARGQGGLIAAGVVLTVALVLASAIDVPISGGMGERTERPSSLSALEDEYRLGIGELTVDLTRLAGRVSPPAVGPVLVKARVGIGRLLVIVPATLPLRIEGRAGLGNVRLLDEEDSGVDVRVVSPGAGVPVLDLRLSVGIGQVELRDG